MSSVTGELERLTALHKEGALTDEELAAARQQVLSDGPEEDSDEDLDLALLEAERLIALGQIERDQTSHDKALRCFGKALDIFRSHGDRLGEARALGALGGVYRNQGKYERATDLLTQATYIYREVGSRDAEGRMLRNLGLIFQAQGQFERAIEANTQALQIHQKVGNRGDEGVALGTLANVFLAQGQHERAAEFYRRSLDISREFGDKSLEGITLGNLGEVLIELQCLDEAEDAHRRAISICDDTIQCAAGAFRGSLALLLAQQHKFDEAESMLQTGEPQVEPMPEEHAKFLGKKGQVCHLAGDADGAQASLEAARALAVELNLSGESEVGQAIRALEAVLGEG